MFLDRLEKRSNNINDWKEIYSFEKSYDWDSENYMKEATYFRCIDYISKKFACCSIKVKKEDGNGLVEAKEHRLYKKLSQKPNPYMNAAEMIRSTIALGENYGASGIYIRQIGNDIELYPAKIIDVIIDDIGIFKSKKNNPIAFDITVLNQNLIVFLDEIILYTAGGMNLDGLRSKSINRYLRDSLSSAKKSQLYLNKLFDNGLTNKILVQLTSDIKEEKELIKIQKKFNRLFSEDGRLFTAPAGYNISSLNLSLADAQYEQLRKLSKLEICTGFGLSPSLIGLESSSDIEQEQLRFMSDTLLFKLIQLEQEMNEKLLDSRDKNIMIEINQNTLLRVSPKTQQEIICEYAKNGIYSLEYARKLLGVYSDFENETVTLPSGQVLLKDLIGGNASWQKGGEG